jgi:signal transduction histidine kinase
LLPLISSSTSSAMKSETHYTESKPTSSTSSPVVPPFSSDTDLVIYLLYRSFLTETLQNLTNLISPSKAHPTSNPLSPPQTPLVNGTSANFPSSEASSRRPSATPSIPTEGLGSKAMFMQELEDASTYLSSIRECASHQLHVVTNVLDLSRLESGNVLLSDEVVDPSRVARQVIQMMSGKAFTRSISLILDDSAMPILASSSALAASLPNLFVSPSTAYRTNNSARLVKGDSMTLSQIFLNLVSNAIKFTPPHGKVTLKIGLEEEALTNEEGESKDGRVVLRASVEDSGVGMTEQEMSTIFSRFKQANRKVCRPPLLLLLSSPR